MLDYVGVDNFRSLKNVSLTLKPLNYFCGPNGSGKTNLAEALDFLSNAFRVGLSYAVAEKGGFYNICFRRQRRSRSSITFSLAGNEAEGKRSVSYFIDFGLQTVGETIRSDFYVDSERYSFRFEEEDPQDSFSVEIKREQDKYQFSTFPPRIPDKAVETFPWFKNLERIFLEFLKPRETELLYPDQFRGLFPFPPLFQPEGIKVFRISPRYASAAGAPSVSGELGKYGQNLPSTLDNLYTKHKPAFEELMKWIRNVVPDIESLKANYTQTKQMGLFLQEKGFGTQWYAEDLSDGTLTSIALFVAVLDPRNTTVFIEEPENSLHPWILTKFLELCEQQSNRKQILISTQSPIVVAKATPVSLFLVEKHDGRTSVTTAIQREPMIERIIKKQYLDLGEYWLSGGLEAVPKPPSVEDEELFSD